MGAVSDDVGFVLDNPFNDFAFFEFHGLGHGCWEVDIVLVGRLLSLYELDLSRISHRSSRFG